MKVEIFHDSLAKRIFDLVGAEDKAWLKTKQFITSRFEYYQDQGILLSEEDLEIYFTLF